MFDDAIDFCGDGANASVRRVNEGIDDGWIFGKPFIWASLVDR